MSTRPSPPRRSRRRRGTRTALSLACVAAIAACGGSDDGADPDAESDTGQLVIDGDAAAAAPDDGADDALVLDGAADEERTAPDNASAEELTEEEQALAFAECMRAEGLDWPDPITAADGSIDPLGGRPLREVAGTDRAATQAAADVCAPLLDGASFLPGGGGGFDAETQDAFVEFAECLRGEGLDVDDPDFGAGGANGGPIGSIFGADFDPDDPANAAAIEECSVLFAGGPLGGQGG